MIFDIEIAGKGKMAIGGKGALRAFQNETTPTLDLFVRESLQNSLDAWNGKGEKVVVHYYTGEIETEELTNKLELLGDVLEKEHNSKTNKYIVIKDEGTIGLNGLLHNETYNLDEYGRFEKLVYQIAMAQTDAGAGGSWGYGKTIYSRVGNGLVFYYSRFNDGGIFKSRLAGTYIEDENSDKSLLKKIAQVKFNRGIAWFGKRVEGQDINEDTLPISDENEIEYFLKLFNVNPFINNDTGTIIMIPFVDEQKLLNQLKLPNKETYMTGSLEGYLELSTKKWYFPRLNNNYYYEVLKKPYLKAYVNGEEIFENKDEDETVFYKQQKMYNFCLESLKNKKKTSVDYGDGYYVEPCVQRINHHNTPVGYFCFKKFNSTELNYGFGLPDRIPYDILGVYEAEENTEKNKAVISYCRLPGMIVDYDYEGKWSNGIVPSKKNEFILAIFVANSYEKFNDNKTLEEYFRSCEVADHHSWMDGIFEGDKQNIISKIINKTKLEINNKYDVIDEVKEIGKIHGIGSFLANKLLPNNGFGKKPSIPNTPPTPTNGGRVSSDKIKMTLPKNFVKYSKDGIVLKSKLIIGHKVKTAKILINVMGEGNKGVEIPQFIKDTTLNSPFEILKVDMSISASNKENNNICKDTKKSLGKNMFGQCKEHDKIDDIIEINALKYNGIFYGIEFSSLSQNKIIVDCEIKLKVNENKYKAKLVAIKE